MADPEAIRRAIEALKGKGPPAPEDIEPSGNVAPSTTALAERPRPSTPLQMTFDPGLLQLPFRNGETTAAALPGRFEDPREPFGKVNRYLEAGTEAALSGVSYGPTFGLPQSERSREASRTGRGGLRKIFGGDFQGGITQLQEAHRRRDPIVQLASAFIDPFLGARILRSIFKGPQASRALVQAATPLRPNALPAVTRQLAQGQPNILPGTRPPHPVDPTLLQQVELSKAFSRGPRTKLAILEDRFRDANLAVRNLEDRVVQARQRLNQPVPTTPVAAQPLATQGRLATLFPEGQNILSLRQAFRLARDQGFVKTQKEFQGLLESEVRAGLIDGGAGTAGRQSTNSVLGVQYIDNQPVGITGYIERPAIKPEAPPVPTTVTPQERFIRGEIELFLDTAEEQLRTAKAVERQARIDVMDAENAARGKIAKEELSRENLRANRPRLQPIEPPRRPAIEAPPTPPAQVPPKVVDVVAPTVDPTPLGRNILDLRPIQVGLSESEELANVARRTVGRVVGAIPDSEISTPALAERTRARAIVESQANRLATVSASRLARAFDFDDAGRISGLANVDPTVPGAPTIQDVAARLPQYNASLTDEQRAVLAALRDETTPYGRLLRELGEEVPTRADISPGGFYVPRGRAALEGADEPVKVRAGVRGGGRPGSLRPASIGSQAAGIEDGLEYASVEDALFAMVTDVGNRAVDRHVANFFANVVDPETGVRFASSVADRTDPVLRGQVETLRAKISARLKTIQSQIVRGKAERLALRDINRLVDKADAQRMRVAKTLKGRAERGATDVAFAETERELNVLDRVVRRVDRAAGRAGQRFVNTVTREAVTADNIARMRAELNALKGRWDIAKRRAQATPRDQGIIGIPGLESLTFPDEIANAANKVLRDQGAAFGEGAGLTRIHRAFNNLYRGMRATLDNSAPGIQGLLGLANDQKAWAGALRVNLHAWRDGKALGQFIDDFDRAASTAKRLSSTEWTKRRLRLGGAQTEFRIGGGSGPIGQAVERIPLVRQANRAFGFFGDSLRLGWADDLLKEELRRGRTLQEIVSSGDAERIARTVNNMTGWSEGRTFGALGDLLLFAPRFLQSRLETVTKAGLSIRPGAPLDQRIARKSLVKMVGFATVLTVALNEMQGEKTDFRPIVNGRFNSNFMRVRFGGRDWSLMGTWDSLARAIVTTASGKPQDALRGMSSGVVTTAWDLISGDDFIGRSVRDDPADFAKWMLRTITPFAGEEIPEAVSQVAKGVTDSDVGSAVAGVTTIGGELSGAKSSPLTPFEQREIVREQTRIKLRDAEPEGSTRFANPYRHPDTGGDEKAAVDAQPEVRAATEKVSKRRRERGSDFQDYVDEQTEINDAFYAEVEKAGLRMASRSAVDIGFGGAEFRAELAKDQRSRADAHARNRKTHQKTLDALSKRDAPTAEFDIARDEYAELFFDPELSDPVTGQYDFSERDSRRTAYVKKHGADMLRRVEDHNRRNEPEILKRLRADRETLKSYWNITSTFMEAYGLTRQYENWSLRAKNERNIYIESIEPPSRQKLFRQVLVLAGNEKKLQRENRQAIRDPLLFWGYIDLEVSDVIARQEAVAVGQ